MIVREVEEVPIGVRRSEESFYRLTWRGIYMSEEMFKRSMLSCGRQVIATTPLIIYIEGKIVGIYNITTPIWIELAFMKKDDFELHATRFLESMWVLSILMDNISHDQLVQLLQGCISKSFFWVNHLCPIKNLFSLQGMPFYQNDSWWMNTKKIQQAQIGSFFSHKHIDPSSLQTISISFSDPISYSTFDENKPWLPIVLYDVHDAPTSLRRLQCPPWTSLLSRHIAINSWWPLQI